MLTSQLRKALIHLIAVLETDARPFTELIGAFATAQRDVEQQLPTFASSNDKWQGSSSHIHSVYSSAVGHLAAHSYRTVFPASQALQTALRTLADSFANRLASELADEVEAFEKLLDEYVGSHSMRHAPLVLSGASKLAAGLAWFQAWAEATIDVLASKQPDDGEEVLELHFDIDPTFADLAVRLNALQELTELLKAILRDLGHDVTYRLVKLETGSCYIELVAQKVGIVALKNLLIGLGGFFYRTRTNEGQLKHGVPLQSAAIREAIKVQQSLKKAGIDAPGVDEALAQQAELFVKSVSILVGAAHGMKVGDTDLHRADGQRMLPRQVLQPRISHDAIKSDLDKPDRISE